MIYVHSLGLKADFLDMGRVIQIMTIDQFIQIPGNIDYMYVNQIKYL